MTYLPKYHNFLKVLAIAIHSCFEWPYSPYFSDGEDSNCSVIDFLQRTPYALQIYVA